MRCGICLNDITSKERCEISCGHQFCYFCICEWARHKGKTPTCPECRYVIQLVFHDDKWLPLPDQVYVTPSSQEEMEGELQALRNYNDAMAERPLQSQRVLSSLVPARRAVARLRSAGFLPQGNDHVLETIRDFRRFVYRTKLYGRLPAGQLYRREVSPKFFQRFEGQISRVARWFDRELRIVLCNNAVEAERLQEVAKRLLRQLPHELRHSEILSFEFRHFLEKYLRDDTRLFLHEFSLFASSPYESWEEFVSGVIYDEQPSFSANLSAHASTTVSPTVVTIDDDDCNDVEIIDHGADGLSQEAAFASSSNSWRTVPNSSRMTLSNHAAVSLPNHFDTTSFTNAHDASMPQTSSTVPPPVIDLSDGEDDEFASFLVNSPRRLAEQQQILDSIQASRSASPASCSADEPAGCSSSNQSSLDSFLGSGLDRNTRELLPSDSPRSDAQADDDDDDDVQFIMMVSCASSVAAPGENSTSANTIASEDMCEITREDEGVERNDQAAETARVTIAERSCTQVKPQCSGENGLALPARQRRAHTSRMSTGGPQPRNLPKLPLYNTYKSTLSHSETIASRNNTPLICQSFKRHEEVNTQDKSCTLMSSATASAKTAVKTAFRSKNDQAVRATRPASARMDEDWGLTFMPRKSQNKHHTTSRKLLRKRSNAHEPERPVKHKDSPRSSARCDRRRDDFARKPVLAESKQRRSDLSRGDSRLRWSKTERQSSTLEKRKSTADTRRSRARASRSPSPAEFLGFTPQDYFWMLADYGDVGHESKYGANPEFDYYAGTCSYAIEDEQPAPAVRRNHTPSRCSSAELAAVSGTSTSHVKQHHECASVHEMPGNLFDNMNAMTPSGTKGENAAGLPAESLLAKPLAVRRRHDAETTSGDGKVAISNAATVARATRDIVVGQKPTHHNWLKSVVCIPNVKTKFVPASLRTDDVPERETPNKQLRSAVFVKQEPCFLEDEDAESVPSPMSVEM